MKYKILNSRERKKLFLLINEQFGSNYTSEHLVLSNKEKVYILTKKFDEVPDEVLYYFQAGMYFANYMKDGIRLTIEGSQIIGPLAKKNVLVLDNNQINDWIKGKDLEGFSEELGYYIIKNQNDFYGTGKIKEGKLLNYVPKGRRLINIH